MTGSHRRVWIVAGVWSALLAALALIAPGFFSGPQLRALFVNAAPLMVAAAGATIVLIARQIDISIGSVFSVCGVVAGLVASAGWPMPVAMTLALAAGALLGALNGLLVAGFRLPSIVVTLATLVGVREVLRFVREGEFVRDLPPGFQWFGFSQATGQWLLPGAALTLFAVLAWGMAHLQGGRDLYALGSDFEAARLAGIRPRRTQFALFVASGLLAGVASLLSAVRFANVDPNAGAGLELQAIAAAVVGGTAVQGGRGTLAGTLAGVLLLSTIAPALVFLHVEPQWERAVQGGLILAAVASDRFFLRRP